MKSLHKGSSGSGKGVLGFVLLQRECLDDCEVRGRPRAG